LVAGAQQPLRQKDASKHRNLTDEQGEAIEGLVQQDQGQSTEESKERQATRKPEAMTLVATVIASDRCIEIDCFSLDLALVLTLFGEVPQDHRSGAGMDLLEPSKPLLTWKRAGVTYDLGGEDRFFGNWTSDSWLNRHCGASIFSLPGLHINAMQLFGVQIPDQSLDAIARLL
jgi:hypothetical protein